MFVKVNKYLANDKYGDEKWLTSVRRERFKDLATFTNKCDYNIFYNPHLSFKKL